MHRLLKRAPKFLPGLVILARPAVNSQDLIGHINRDLQNRAFAIRKAIESGLSPIHSGSTPINTMDTNLQKCCSAVAQNCEFKEEIAS